MQYDANSTPLFYNLVALMLTKETPALAGRATAAERLVRCTAAWLFPSGTVIWSAQESKPPRRPSKVGTCADLFKAWVGCKQHWVIT